MKEHMLLEEVLIEVQSEGYYVGTWDTIDEALDIYIDAPSGITEFKSLLNNAGLDCFPKIVNGSVANIEKSLVSIPLVIFRKSSPLDRNKNNIKYALLVGRIGAAMAKVDGKVDQAEINQIRSDIYNLSFLTESEKYRVFIRSIFALHQNTSKEYIINSFSQLSMKAKLQALNIAKDIAIADRFINRNERLFLYEFYRLCDIPTSTVSRDLKVHAKRKNIELIKNSNVKVDTESGPMVVDDAFDEILAEFESF